MAVCRLDKGKPHRLLELDFVLDDEYVAGLFYFTGPANYIRGMCHAAREQMIHLSEYGMW